MKLENITNSIMAIGIVGTGMMLANNEIINNIGRGAILGSIGNLLMYGIYLKQQFSNLNIPVKIAERTLYD